MKAVTEPVLCQKEKLNSFVRWKKVFIAQQNPGEVRTSTEGLLD